ncbi:hypothetical protein TWF173_003360 [Orbilia oligospora]|nr:hypothetical protein TWF173_003360 [Orbilia oligospora]
MLWSTTGAQHAINQAALPALVLALNRAEGRDEWTSEDGQDILTKHFFDTVKDQIVGNKELEEMAHKYGIPIDGSNSTDENFNPMKELLLKSYSSVHVHFIPQMGLGKLGTTAVVFHQMKRLQTLIKVQSQSVQRIREKSQTKFNNKQLISITSYAFSHVSENDEAPFDFGLCRQFASATTNTQSIETYVVDFLKICFDRAIKKNTSIDCSQAVEEKESIDTVFEATTSFLASAMVKRAQSSKNQVVIEAHMFQQDMKAVFKTAMHKFLEDWVPCSYVDDMGWKCSNSKSGHSKGHQTKLSSDCFAGGDFKSGLFDTYNEDELTKSIESKVYELTRKAGGEAGSNPRRWHEIVEAEHVENVKRLRELKAYPQKVKVDSTSSILDTILNPIKALLKALSEALELYQFISLEFCFGCLFGKSEYRLPCQHLICTNCLKENSTPNPGVEPEAMLILEECIFCGDKDEEKGWPFTVQIPMKLTSPRILSLDGAGVGAITQLVLLVRLEKLIGLGLPIGRFFDLIVGSSTGGVVAIGIGSRGFSATECLKRFKVICEKGFVSKLGTKTLGLQLIMRWFYKSVYDKDEYKKALEQQYGGDNSLVMFGLRNHCHVAVTTTVELDSYLIANYHTGDGKKYIDSIATPWKVAQCTSAAPLYFPPVPHGEVECRDGGLMANNPIKLVIDEAERLWDGARPGIVLSIGTGRSDSRQPEPIGLNTVDEKLLSPFKTWLTTMNGEQGWSDFCDSKTNDPDLLARCNRLNVKLKNEVEPAFDSFQEITSMELAAKEYDDRYRVNLDTPYTPILGACEDSILKVQAEILRASQFFFQVGEISWIIQGPQRNLLKVTGRLKCRLGAQERGAFWSLLNMTSYFAVNGKKDFDMDAASRSRDLKLFDRSLEFTHITTSGPIRIDALRDHCAKNGIEENEIGEGGWEEATSSMADAEGEVNPDTSGSKDTLG